MIESTSRRLAFSRIGGTLALVATSAGIVGPARAAHLAKTPTGEIAADLTNSLLPDCVLVPSVVAFLVELQTAGFTYVKGS